MKQFVFVSGFDYEFKGTDFNIFSTRRRDKLIKQNPKTNLKFTFFDFKRGKITSEDITYPSGVVKNTSTIVKDSFDKISSSNYVIGKFKNGQRNTLSIKNVYDFVSDIGMNDPNTLDELSFFSHAWMGGPIFVNSFNDRSTVYTGTPGTSPPPSQIDISDPNKRDPDDKDGRANDFSSPTMDINLFKKAFSSNGYSWIWGCTATEVYKDMINTIQKMRQYSGAGTKDSEKFIIYNTDFLLEFDEYLNHKPKASSKAITVTFADVKSLFSKVLQNTYAFNLAHSTGKKVYSAFVGVGSNNEPGPKGLMIADRYRKNVIDFYKTHLGIKIDPEGRNYAEYLPTFSSVTSPVL
ncbi:MAG: hypothetical protein D8M58_03050 [Calditrichaeota bacterium]|nr:MAG: hypothetical protein DWQ03_04030 [Calditrichota bacterium]MBL1204343.1 hypothetical protein [Calditrichota bacterium]NOG44172.1 hypothetical protein [Calditrichota bacterium]